MAITGKMGSSGVRHWWTMYVPEDHQVAQKPQDFSVGVQHFAQSFLPIYRAKTGIFQKDGLTFFKIYGIMYMY